MEVKLIKTEVNYLLKDEQFNVIISTTSLKKEGLALSLKNCQAIERGYDLDELAKEFVDYEDSLYHSTIKNTYMHGFQKALEIRSDKKFSEEDMRKAIGISKNGSMQEQHNGYGGSAIPRFVLDNLPSDEIIQSLQQTEWDVEIVMEYVGKIKLNKLHEMKPKLDEDGCLILKRKI